VLPGITSIIDRYTEWPQHSMTCQSEHHLVNRYWN